MCNLVIYMCCFLFLAHFLNQNAKLNREKKINKVRVKTFFYGNRNT